MFFQASPSAHLFSAACIYPLTYWDSGYFKEEFFFALFNLKSSFQLSLKHKLIQIYSEYQNLRLTENLLKQLPC